MKRLRMQKGFSLVLVLSLLTLAGGFALAKMPVGLQPTLTFSRALLKNATLGQSRQSLLSYSAHYPQFYGPKGAGVGHLPCPDTDSLPSDDARWSVAQGPNPPCKSNSVAVGNLPAHISFPQGRYMIHAGMGDRVAYAVSARVINNPSNQVVNPKLMSSSADDFPQAVFLQQHSSLGSVQSYEVMLSNVALMLAIRPAVAAWVIGKLEEQGSSNCFPNQKEESQQEQEQ